MCSWRGGVAIDSSECSGALPAVQRSLGRMHLVISGGEKPPLQAPGPGPPLRWDGMECILRYCTLACNRFGNQLCSLHSAPSSENRHDKTTAATAAGVSRSWPCVDDMLVDGRLNQRSSPTSATRLSSSAVRLLSRAPRDKLAAEYFEQHGREGMGGNVR